MNLMLPGGGSRRREAELQSSLRSIVRDARHGPGVGIADWSRTSIAAQQRERQRGHRGQSRHRLAQPRQKGQRARSTDSSSLHNSFAFSPTKGAVRARRLLEAPPPLASFAAARPLTPDGLVTWSDSFFGREVRARQQLALRQQSGSSFGRPSTACAVDLRSVRPSWGAQMQQLAAKEAAWIRRRREQNSAEIANEDAPEEADETGARLRYCELVENPTKLRLELDQAEKWLERASQDVRAQRFDQGFERDGAVPAEAQAALERAHTSFSKAVRSDAFNMRACVSNSAASREFGCIMALVALPFMRLKSRCDRRRLGRKRAELLLEESEKRKAQMRKIELLKKRHGADWQHALNLETEQSEAEMRRIFALMDADGSVRALRW
eukprot:SAG11_NODE_4098_length_2066_cov_0.814438_1_plen_382_part_00